MSGAHVFLQAITVVLGVAAVTTVLFHRLRLPVVLGYILAGLIVGPHIPVPLVADEEVIKTLSELGVILLMFSLGLEFSLRKLIAVAPTAGLAALVETSVMVWLGFRVGRAFGWTPRESLFSGAIVAISSTTIVARAFAEQGVKGRLRELVVGVLIVEDLIAILLMAVLTALATGDRVSFGTIAESGGRLAAFLVGVLSVGLLLVPRAVRAVQKLKSPETTLVASIGLCFGVALLAQWFGYSVALGAFLAGSLVAESGEEKAVEHLVVPVRDLFAAIFFVSVGMQVDPAVVAANWVAVVVFTVLVVLGKSIGVSLGAFLSGSGVRTSVQAGLSLAQIGEFSFIIAGLGLSLGATSDFLFPLAIAVSAVTTLTTPLLIRASGPIAEFVDRKLPKPLQTFAALYGTWFERLRESPSDASARAGADARRRVRLLLVDAVVIVLLVIGTSVWLRGISSTVSELLGVDVELARRLTIAGAFTLSVPLVVGLVRSTRGLGLAWSEIALPTVTGRVDLAAAPRRAFVVGLQLLVAIAVGLPMLAVTQPFVGQWPGTIVFVALLAGLGVVFWRSATNLQGHVKAGAEVIVEALAAQTAHEQDGADAALERVRALLPGLGEPVAFRVPESSPVVGHTLASLNLRGLTGASVLAIARGEDAVLVPTAQESLLAGDVLALAGTRDAVEAATALLTGTPPATTTAAS